MRFAYTDRFRKAYAGLAERDAKRVRKALELLSVDPRHPSLRVKKMQGTARIWEARASNRLRITFEIDGDRIVLRNVGSHDPTLCKP